jgi:hypothetical protein
MVEAYCASDVQNGLAAATEDKAWVKGAAQALVDAKILKHTTLYKDLLQRVQALATVFAVGKDSRLQLHARDPGGGSLKLLAIPLSSNYASWYPHADWAVHPVCTINPRLVSVTMQATSRDLGKAITAVRNTLLYFVHTYSKSNAKLVRV